jgi:hypothetical protein
MSISLKSIGVGKIVEFAGVGIFLTGIALAFEHFAIAACVTAGAAAFFAGKKLSGR